MSTLTIIYIYLATVPVFFIIDMIWLGFIGRGVYQKYLGYLLGDINWAAAIVFYLLYIVGILVFAVFPGIDAGSFWKTVALGAFFGFVAYATYDLTNLATVRDWPLTISIIDMIWGTVLTASVAAISYYIATTWIL